MYMAVLVKQSNFHLKSKYHIICSVYDFDTVYSMEVSIEFERFLMKWKIMCVDYYDKGNAMEWLLSQCHVRVPLYFSADFL